MINAVEFRPHHGVPHDQVWPLLDVSSRSFVLRFVLSAPPVACPLRDHHVASGGVTDSDAEVEQVIALSISEGCVLEHSISGMRVQIACAGC